MRIVNPSFEILDRRKLSIWQKIEQAGRIAYKSEDKITDLSAPKFCASLFEVEHSSVMEFANFHYLVKGCIADRYFATEIEKFMSVIYGSKYIDLSFAYKEDSEKTNSTEAIGMIISGSFRAFIDGVSTNSCNTESEDYSVIAHAILSDISCIHGNEIYPPIGFAVLNNYGEFCTPISPAHYRRVVHPAFYGNMKCAVKFIVNRAVTHELVRHRPCSYLQESQRWCRYSQGKFNNEVTFIKPVFFEESSCEYAVWNESMRLSEKTYMDLLKTSSPQAARTVLPNSCKTEILVYTSISEWEHIFKLRTPKAADPSMREVMIPLSEIFFSPENQDKWE